jgi:hypothetical protein
MSVRTESCYVVTCQDCRKELAVVEDLVKAVEAAELHIEYVEGCEAKFLYHDVVILSVIKVKTAY